MTMQQGNADLDGTINALQGGLTAVNPAAAVSVIESWQQTLQGAGLGGIVSDLGELKGELLSGNLDGKRIGPILSRLGTQTTSAAANAPADVSAKLRQLGQMLTGAGDSIK